MRACFEGVRMCVCVTLYDRSFNVFVLQFLVPMHSSLWVLMSNGARSLCVCVCVCVWCVSLFFVQKSSKYVQFSILFSVLAAVSSFQMFNVATIRIIPTEWYDFRPKRNEKAGVHAKGNNFLRSLGRSVGRSVEFGLFVDNFLIDLYLVPFFFSNVFMLVLRSRKRNRFQNSFCAKR